MDKRQLIESHGYKLAPRDPAVRPEFKGAWMVTDTLAPEGFAIVGDDPEKLLDETIDHNELL